MPESGTTSTENNMPIQRGHRSDGSPTEEGLSTRTTAAPSGPRLDRRALLVAPIALFLTPCTASAKPPGSDRATDLRDAVRDRNGRAKSFRISWHDPDQAFRRGDFEGFGSRQTTWFDGSQYLMQMADEEGRPIFYQWMSRDFTILGPLDAAEDGARSPRRGEPAPSSTWPPSPNLADPPTEARGNLRRMGVSEADDRARTARRPRFSNRTTTASGSTSRPMT